jgi:hypothetical protein
MAIIQLLILSSFLAVFTLTAGFLLTRALMRHFIGSRGRSQPTGDAGVAELPLDKLDLAAKVFTGAPQ